jgi:hypothetical protein
MLRRFRFVEAVSLQDGGNRAHIFKEVAPPCADRYGGEFWLKVLT